MTACVRTVLGDVRTDELGAVDAHEHLLIVGGPATVADPDVLLDDESQATEEAVAFRRAGGGTIVDAMPSGCGRDALGLARVARAAGIHVVATAGLHKQEYYDGLHWARRYSSDQIAALLIDECRLGLDRWDHCGPFVERTEVRPGLLKLATGYNAIRPMERRAIEAVTAAQLATELPVITHADGGTLALEQIELLTGAGVPVARIAINHLDRNPDAGLHLAIAQTGAYLTYDGLARERQRPTSAVVALIACLIENGHAGQLLLGGDIARRSLRRSNGGPGAAGLLDDFIPRLRAEGVSDDVLDGFLVRNPARFLSLEPASTHSHHHSERTVLR
jgi:predicted metal-dependent phosphotriesterase family hydrolase